MAEPTPASPPGNDTSGEREGAAGDNTDPGDGTAYLAQYIAESRRTDPRLLDLVERLVWIGRDASIQFAHPFPFHILAVRTWSTYEAWVWLEGVQLDANGEFVLLRTIWVKVAGLADVPDGHPAHHRARRRPITTLPDRGQPRRTRWSLTPLRTPDYNDQPSGGGPAPYH